jgi:hypothetical protein
MSNRYKGGVISATPPTTTGGEEGTASGAWTLEQQMQLQAAGLWPAQPTGPYIEQVFSTYLYTGDATARSITNGIDLATKGGLVWIKNRTFAGSDHQLFDTARGATKRLFSNLTDAEVTTAGTLTSFDTTGFSIGTQSSVNFNTYPQVSWTFREQPKFFDVVTYTGNGTAGRTVAHNLGSVPGCMIVKRTDASNGWAVYHRSMNASPQDYMMRLNATDAAFTTSPSRWNNTLPTATEFTLSGNDEVNGSGATYVAYLFAHNAGGFGLTGTDNVISCGSFTTDGSGNATVNLGYEPQWVLMKPSTTATSGNWIIADNMRGWTIDGAGGNANQQLYANSSSAESGGTPANLTSTGFNFTSSYGPWASQTWIYIAIRRGPMRVPTSGTSVFAPVAYSGNNSSTRQLTSGFPIDLIIGGDRSSPPSNVFDRLRGVSSASPASYTASTADEQTSVYGVLGMTYLQTGDGTVRYQNSAGTDYVDYFFRRAPSFFDELCYTGTGSALTLSHNLTVTPEFTLIKERTNDGISNWAANYNFTATTYVRDILNRNDSVPAVDTYGSGGNNYAAAPTATTITVGAGLTNANGSTYVAYLFATCAGVSKVGNYTGTGALQTINCGFAAGARFVLIKRTDSTGDWWVYDSARGITSGNDPYLFWNSTSAEVTGTNYVDTDVTGFKVTAAAPAGLNASGGTYIFLAIA